MNLLGSLKKKMVTGSLIALSLLLVMGFVSLLSIQRLVSSAAQVRSVQTSVERLEATLSHLKDAETGTRGYLITGKTNFLEPYQKALEQLTHDLAVLPEELHSSKNISMHLPYLQLLVNNKLALLKQMIDLYQKEEFQPASQIERLESGKSQMDQIRLQISQMQTEERNLLYLRERQNEQLIIITRVIILGASFLAIFCVLAATNLIRRDIIKRRYAEAKLLQSEELLNDAQYIAKTGSWEYDVENDKLWVSAVLCHIFEVPAAEHTLETAEQFYSFLHPEDRKQLEEAANHSIRTGESFQMEYRLLLSEGKQKYILSYVRPIKEAEGEVKKVRGTCQDITEQKYTQDALVYTEKLFSTIFRLNPFPTAITRLSDGKVIVVNEKGLEVFGYTVMEITNLTTVDLGLWHYPEERLQLIEQVKVKPVLEFEKRYRTKDGKEWDAITYIEMIEWDREPCLLIILQDITERKKAQEATKAYAEQLEKINLSKDKFFSIIAHDLLSPLNGVLGSAELLGTHHSKLTEQEIQTLSQSIHISTMHLKRLLTNLLEWARMQKGEISCRPKNVDLHKLAVEEIASLQENAQQKDITIELAIPESLRVEADEHMLRAVIRNLVANAIKFSNMGGNICIACKQSDSQVHISVRDQGIGMSKQVQNRLFQLDVKHTSIGTAGEKGTGLGLMLCKEFVEKHGGHIWVESEEKKGTTFHFILPQ
ncbi:PAS domain S-box protein [Rhodocytophaga rosea]|uniref:histidine kinase n=1 Tax=Rhodocytophaga rosea TaxID=2704465 RepID=A0A6C0GE52_9BACT|nr:ATP-binding protein [Rhodocytophaga rosea]QHT66251.1 PAS domain S-box protein [Rhodocytophaga rosea]